MLVLAEVTTSRPDEAKPNGSVRVFNAAGTLLDEVPLTLPTGKLPATAPAERSFATSYSAKLQARHVAPGMRLSVQLAGGVLAKSLQPRVGADNAMSLVMVPVRVGSSVGQVFAGADQAITLRAPVASVSLSTNTVYTSTGVTKLPARGWTAADLRSVLEEMSQLRQLENASPHTYYMGIVPIGNLGVSGIGFAPGHTSVVLDASREPDNERVLNTVQHELGHNFGLLHALCNGTEADIDPEYPYAAATLGAAGRYIWGYRWESATFIDPRNPAFRDIMSYCDGSHSFSDYNFHKMQSNLAGAGADRFIAAAPTAASARAAPEELLSVVGSISGNSATLRPLKSFEGVAEWPQAGNYQLRLTTSNGDVVYDFRPSRVDHDNSTLSFAFSVPRPGPILSVQILRNGAVLLDRALATTSNTARADRQAAGSSHPSAQVQFTEQRSDLDLSWDAAAYPFLTVIHVGSRRSTLAQDMKGGSGRLSTSTLPAGGSYEFILSDGMNSVRVVSKR